MEKLEHTLREKGVKIRDATKKIGEVKLDIKAASAKREIASRRLNELTLLN